MDIIFFAVLVPHFGEITTSLRWPSVKPTYMPVVSLPGQIMWQPEAKVLLFDHLGAPNFGGE
jgi:hypothetical protein